MLLNLTHWAFKRSIQSMRAGRAPLWAHGEQIGAVRSEGEVLIHHTTLAKKSVVIETNNKKKEKATQHWFYFYFSHHTSASSQHPACLSVPKENSVFPHAVHNECDGGWSGSLTWVFNVRLRDLSAVDTDCVFITRIQSLKRDMHCQSRGDTAVVFLDVH